jgi:hypothetical protein
MSNMLLKIVNENFGNSQFRTLGDPANHQHVFEWNATHGAYCYAPKSQQESDDIISTNWVSLNCPWRVAPIWDGQPATNSAAAATNAAAAGSAKIPPFVPKAAYAQYPVRDLLDLCADAGFIPQGDTANSHNLRLQLDRYYEGRAWAAEDMKRLREKVVVLERAGVKAPAQVAAPEPVKPAARRGRPAKKRELQPA